jgi:hypothetical protein
MTDKTCPFFKFHQVKPIDIHGILGIAVVAEYTGCRGASGRGLRCRRYCHNQHNNGDYSRYL